MLDKIDDLFYLKLTSGAGVYNKGIYLIGDMGFSFDFNKGFAAKSATIFFGVL